MLVHHRGGIRLFGGPTHVLVIRIRPASVRGTYTQDVPSSSSRRPWYGGRAALAAAGAALAAALIWLVRTRSVSTDVVSGRSLERATVTRGPFLDEVAARGIAIVTVSQTVYATAQGSVR